MLWDSHWEIDFSFLFHWRECFLGRLFLVGLPGQVFMWVLLLHPILVESQELCTCSVYIFICLLPESEPNPTRLSLKLKDFYGKFCFVLFCFLKPWYSGITFGNNRTNCGSERLLLVDYDHSDGIYSRNLTANRFVQKKNGKWDSMIVFIFCTLILIVNWYIYHW